MDLNYTPIKDKVTGVSIKIGDLCKNEKGYIGRVAWDDYLNQYILKSESGGNLYSRTYTKVKSIKLGTKPDNTKVECRKQPFKKKW